MNEKLQADVSVSKGDHLILNCLGKKFITDESCYH